MNLRKQINQDLEFSMENLDGWGLPVVLIDPDGVIHDTKKDSTDKLTGQVLHDFHSFNPDSGEDMIFNDPIVVLRLDSLVRIPKDGENWAVKIPETPDPEAELKTYLLTPNKAMKFNRSIGFVRMYLSSVGQS